MSALCIQISALLPLLLFAAAQGCGETQYSERIPNTQSEVCCDYCAEGQQISKICTSSNSASKCKDCGDNYYNPKKARGPCKACFFCLKGSIEISPCNRSANAVCACPEGSTPKNDMNTACACEKGKEIVDNKCQPCRSGYFSTQENSICQPWTDCITKGETVLEAGSATQDVKCTNAKKVPVHSVPVAVTLTQTLPSPGRSSAVTQSSKKITLNVSVTEDPVENSSISWGLLSLILIGVALLSVSAGIILAMNVQTNREKRIRGFSKFERCKLPVQEESTSSDGSLAKQCPA